MQISASTIDDFKTERKDLLPPLPMAFRVVPLIFYGSVLFLAAIGTLASLHKKTAVDRATDAAQRLSDMKVEIAGLEATEKTLANDISEARDMEAWVLASMPVQPLVVSIMRSIDLDASVVRLSLEREPENPSQLKLELRLKSDSDAQLEKTLKYIRNEKPIGSDVKDDGYKYDPTRLSYIEIAPTQTREKGELEYRATLIWVDPEGKDLQTPEERASQVIEP